MFCAFSVAAFSQQIVTFINSPGSLEGNYNFTHSFDSNWGADPSTGTWTGDVVFVESTGATAPANEGCDSLINAAELDGNIAMVDRGSCNFSLKALNAQNAGAIACVIINHSPGGPVGMGAGNFATDVTIPVIMLSLEDGDLIKDVMANETVNMTIGAFYYPNDIGSGNSDILRNPNGVMPADQATAANASFLPGALISNNGQNDATNVILSTTITHTPMGGGSSSNVHNDAVTIDLLEADSARIYAMDNEFLAEAGTGVYTVDYNITADSVDNFDFDNNHSFDYILSENAYCKGNWDADNDRPFQNAAFTISGGSQIEFLTGFEMPLGVGYTLESVQFYMTGAAAGPTLGEIGADKFTTYVYRWDDANEDGSVLNDELSIVAIGIVESFPDHSSQEAWMDVPLIDFETLEPGAYVVPEDDNTYFIGVRYSGTDQVFFGFDTNYDQYVYFDNISPTLATLSYFFVDTWVDIKPDIEGDAGVFTDFYASSAQALRLGQAGGSSVGENNPEIGTFEVFPNPVSNSLNVETKLAKNYDRVDYTIIDNNGSVVSIISRGVKGTVDNTSLDVSGLAAGQYYLNVNTVDGSVSKAFTVQR
jgi:hypothetical protein